MSKTAFAEILAMDTPSQSQVWFADGGVEREANVPTGHQKLFDAACATNCPTNTFQAPEIDYGMLGSIYRLSIEDESSGMGSSEKLEMMGVDGEPEEVCCTPYPLLNVKKRSVMGSLKTFGFADSQCWLEMEAIAARGGDPSQRFKLAISFGISKMAKFANHLSWHGRPGSGIYGLMTQPGIPAIYLEGLAQMSPEEIQATLEMAYLAYGRSNNSSNGYANVMVMPIQLKGVLNLRKFTGTRMGGLDAFLESNPQINVVFEDELAGFDGGCCPCTNGIYFTYFSAADGDPTRIIRSHPLPIGIFDPHEDCNGRITMKFFAHLGSTWQPRPGDGLKVLLA